MMSKYGASHLNEKGIDKKVTARPKTVSQVAHACSDASMQVYILAIAPQSPPCVLFPPGAIGAG